MLGVIAASCLEALVLFLGLIILGASREADANAYVYSAGSMSADFGNRTVARALCTAAKPGAIPTCSGTIVPLVLYSGETLAGITSGLTGAAVTQALTVISSSFGSPYLSANLSAHFSRHWSGMTASGEAMQRGTCLDWTVTSSKAKGYAGWTRPSYFAANCAQSLHLLCGCGIAATKSPTVALRRR